MVVSIGENSLKKEYSKDGVTISLEYLRFLENFINSRPLRLRSEQSQDTLQFVTLEVH